MLTASSRFALANQPFQVLVQISAIDELSTGFAGCLVSLRSQS